MNPMHEKEPQATVERDLEPGIGRREEYHAAWSELRKARRALPSADRKNARDLIEEYIDHMREANHHQQEAYFVMISILDNLVGFGGDE